MSGCLVRRKEKKTERGKSERRCEFIDVVLTCSAIVNR